MRHAVSPAGDPIHRQGWVQDGTPTQRRPVQSLDLLLKKIENGVSTNVLSKSNHTHGGGITEYHAHGTSTIRLGFDLRKEIFMQGFI